jgi:hypothetical protein
VIRLALALFPAVALAAPKPLAIQTVRLAQYEDGPPVSSGFEFFPGDSVFVRGEVGGYKATEAGKIHLEFEMIAVDPEGLALSEPVRGKVQAELAPEDKDWLPKVRGTFLVPPTAPTGNYSLTIRVTDKMASASATTQTTAKVRGVAVEPSPVLVARNFRFLRSEEDGPPLKTAAYRPGETLWARLEITGYKLGEKNLVSVDYGIAVLRSNGEKLFEQPLAAEEKEGSYYPKRFVPGALSLNLAKDIRPGEYVIVLTVHDRVGPQTAESRHVFRVE